MFSITGHFKDILCEDDMTNRTLHRSARATRKAPVHFGEQTEKVLSTLAPREEMILRMRFGIGQKASNPRGTLATILIDGRATSPN
jgi:DNA-directed RNA polymerase sigma subunit (sigma70/sigma32)